MSLQRRSESGRKQAKAPSLGSKTPGTPSQQQLSLLRSSHRSCKTASRFRSLPALEGAHRRPVQTYILPTTYLYPVFYTVSHLRQHRLRYNFPRELPPQQGRGHTHNETGCFGEISPRNFSRRLACPEKNPRKNRLGHSSEGRACVLSQVFLRYGTRLFPNCFLCRVYRPTPYSLLRP